MNIRYKLRLWSPRHKYMLHKKKMYRYIIAVVRRSVGAPAAVTRGHSEQRAVSRMDFTSE